MDGCLRNHAYEWSQCQEKLQTGIIINGFSFVICSSLLFFATIPLFKSLLNLQSRNLELTKEMKMLTSIFTVFTATYVIRTIYDFLAPIDGSFESTFWGFALVIIWDLVPLWLMLSYHMASSDLLRKRMR